jgi:hypothetical protein
MDKTENVKGHSRGKRTVVLSGRTIYKLVPLAELNTNKPLGQQLAKYDVYFLSKKHPDLE